MEILVVLAILALLAGLAIMNLGGAHYNAEKATAKLMVDQQLKMAVNMYRMNMGEYPPTAEGLQALVTRPSRNGDRWGGPYIEGKLPPDPWGQPYLYEFPGKHNKEIPDIWSAGRDKISGTEDDITNWAGKTP